jgi:hypothetical protein
MSKGMQIVNDLGNPALVGVLATYTYIQQAATDLPTNVFELLLGNVGTLVLSLIVGYWLYRANQRKDARIEAQHAAALADLVARLEAVTHERNDYLNELLEERGDSVAKPARKRV